VTGACAERTRSGRNRRREAPRRRSASGFLHTWPWRCRRTGLEVARALPRFSDAVNSDEYGPLRTSPDARHWPRVSAEISPHSPTAEVIGLKPTQVRVRIPRRAPSNALIAQPSEAAASNSAQCRFDSCSAHQRLQATQRLLSLVAKAPRLH